MRQPDVSGGRRAGAERTSRTLAEVAARARGALLLSILGLALPPSAVALEVPGTAGRLTASGFVDGLAVVPTEGGKRQRPQGLAALSLDGAISRGLRARFTLLGSVGGPFEGGHQGFLNFVHAFQNHAPSLGIDEAFLDFTRGRLAIRGGIQKFAWGKLDGIPPTDLINPHDFHDPFVRNVKEATIGIPALSATYYIDDVPRLALTNLRATAIYVPFAVPSRLPLILERWFPEQAAPRQQIVVSKRRAEEALGKALGVPVTLARNLVVPIAFRTENDSPPKQLDAGGIAFRLGGSWRATDWDLYHYTGPETGPNAQLRATVILDSLEVDPSTLVADVGLKVRTTLRQANSTMHMTGADFATVLGGATVRAEAAYLQGRRFLRSASELVSPEALARLPLGRITNQLLDRGRAPVPLDGDLFVARDAIVWGIGVDYLASGFIPLFQVNQVVLLDDGPRLLISDPDTQLLGSVRRPFLNEALELELVATYTLSRGAWLVFPRASYLIRQSLRLRIGYLAIGGTRDSVIGQFGRNDELVLQLRYTF